jgi:RND family efflux transporter MFP subunit
MSRRLVPNFCWVTIIVTAIALVACNHPSAVQAPPPPAVTVSQPIQQEVMRWDEYGGTLSSPKTVTVSARVSGMIEQAPFQEGTLVHQGELLFKIDPRPFKADLDNKQAAIQQAKATADKARADFNRYTKLLEARVIAQADYDTTRAAWEEATAALSAAQAAFETSRLNLEWTDVRAPITGRVSRINVTVGNLINGGAGQATPLTTVVSIDPLYSYLNVPEGTALHYQELALQEKRGNVAGARVPCILRLQSGALSRQGAIDFVDNQVDVNTGTVQIRCVISNPTGILTPGLYAFARIPAGNPYRALLIPDAAVNTDQNERYLLVVDKNDVVQQRRVELGDVFGTLRAINDGLNPGEWVIVNGMQHAQPGAKVDPHAAPISAKALDELESIASPGNMTVPLQTTRQASSQLPTEESP